jgi:hypothetical protein
LTSINKFNLNWIQFQMLLYFFVSAQGRIYSSWLPTSSATLWDWNTHM